jgi:hypothetical protein
MRRGDVTAGLALLVERTLAGSPLRLERSRA